MEYGFPQIPMPLPKRILIVEDDPEFGSLLQHFVRNMGHVAVLASTARKALEQARAHKPHLVILDYHLGNKDSRGIARELRKGRAWADPPIIFMSGDKSYDIEEAAFRAHADDFVVKPFDMVRFGHLLRRRLEQGDACRYNSSVLEHGAVRMDVEARKVWIRERETRLPFTLYTLLRLFLENPEKIVPKEDILDSLRSPKALDANPRNVDKTVQRLRRTLLSESGLEIVNEYGRVFRLTQK